MNDVLIAEIGDVKFRNNIEQKVTQLLGDRVAVRVDEVVSQKGSIILPEVVTERPFSGTVVLVGQGYAEKSYNWRPLSVEIGDRVKFSKFAGYEVEFDFAGIKENLLVMREEDILLYERTL